MAASRFVEVTDEEINCFTENAYFSKNLDFVSVFIHQHHLIMHLKFSNAGLRTTEAPALHFPILSALPLVWDYFAPK